MRVQQNHLERVRRALAASVAMLLAAAAAPAAEAAQPVDAPRYAPTMADYLAVYDALQNYRNGVEKHDQLALEKAFWEDGANIAVPTPGGPEIRLPLKEGGPPPARAGQPGPAAGPPPGLAPPPGSNAGPPGPGGAVWHLPLDSYIHFESATRATHYEYFLSVYPQPEKKVEDLGQLPNASSYRTSIVGWPGHYEDILEKRNGVWRIFQRKSMINQK